MAKMILVLVLVAGFCRAASAAALLSGYDDWASLSSEAKIGVVIGMADDTMNPFDEASSLTKAVGDGLGVCIQRLQIKAAAMANAMESWYAAGPEAKAVPAHAVFFSAVTAGICRGFVDAEIRRAGLPYKW